MRVGIVILPAFLMAAWSPAVAEPVRLTTGFVRHDLTPNLELLDTVDCPGWPEVQTRPQEQWRGGFARVPHFGYSRSCMWLRFSIENEQFAEDIFLESRTPFVDSTTLHCTPEGHTSPLTAGDTHPFSARGMRHRFPNFRIHLRPESTALCYVRYESTSFLVAPLVLQSLENAHNVSMGEYAGFGFYFGGLFVLLLYNLLLLFFVRSVAYVWGSLLLLCVLLNHAFAIGFMTQFFFPHNVWISNAGPLVTTAGFGLSAYYFGRATMEIDGSRLRGFDFLVFAGYAILVAAGLLVSLRTAIIALQISFLVVLALNVWRGVRGVRRGMYAIPYFLAGWILALSGALVSVLYNLGVLEFLPAQTALILIPIATILEAVFFTFALSQIRQNKSDFRTLTSGLQRERYPAGPTK